MPIYEYACKNGHKEERFYRSFSVVEPNDCIVCTTCGQPSERQVSLPLQPILYGNPDGYHKPSPTKRHSYKTISEKDGNYDRH